jgi:homoserine kinase type II
MTLAEARAIGSRYDLDVAVVRALSAGSVNSNFALESSAGQQFFLRVYEEQPEAGAARELLMIHELATLGVPTAAPLGRRGGGYVGGHLGKPVGVYQWIDGEILCFGRVTPDVATRLGRALAHVHRCTPALSGVPEGRFGMTGLLARLDRVDRIDASYLDDTQLIRRRLIHYSSKVSASSLPEGLIHGDLFRDNVLWRSAPGGQKELVALLDFESASRGAFVYDVMVCVHAWCYGSAFDLSLVRALLAGYREVRPFERGEIEALADQGALAALRFATTRLTDFSLRAAPGAAPGRDYRRFLARLEALEGGILDPIINEGKP